MTFPFTAEQFFSVFERYNNAVWPAQVVLNLLGLGAIALAAKKILSSDKIISLLLGVREDAGLFIAGIIGTSMLAFRKNDPSTVASGS